MDTIFMNTKNRQTSKPHVLILKFTDKLDLRRGQNRIALPNLNIYYTCKNIKSSYNNNNFKYQHQHGMINLSYLMNRILYQVFKIILNTFLKSMKKILTVSTNICK